jgi:hypothetical protein
MAFVMGWSSLVFASTMPMHAKMLQQQMADPQQVTAVVVSEHEHKTQSNCHLATVAIQHQQHNAHDAQKNHCESGLHSSAAKQCADCAQLHCQTLIVWLDTAVAETLPQLPSDALSNLHGRYTAQHLVGYWQEILRPPKA